MWNDVHESRAFSRNVAKKSFEAKAKENER